MSYILTFLCTFLVMEVLLLVYMVGKVRADVEITKEMIIAFVVEYENTHPNSKLWRRLKDAWEKNDEDA